MEDKIEWKVTPVDINQMKMDEDVTISENNSTASDADIVDNKDIDKPVQQTQDKPVETPISSWEDMMKEKTGGKTWEEYSAEVNELREKVKAPRFEDKFNKEDIERLEGLLGGGLTMDKLGKIVNIQTMDVNKLDSKEALARKLSLVDGLSPEEIKYELMQYDSDLSEDELADLSPKERAAIDASKARLERESRKAKTELEILKAEYKLPEYKIVNNEEQIKQQVELQKKEVERWNSAVNESLNDYKEEVFILDKDTNFKYVVDEQSKKDTKESMENITQFHQRYLVGEGNDKKIDWNKLRREQFILKNFDSIIEKTSKQMYSKAQEDFVKGKINNIDFENKQTTSVEGGKKPLPYEQQKPTVVTRG